MTHSANPRIRLAQPRRSIRVTFPDGSILDGPIGVTVEETVRAHRDLNSGQYSAEIMGAIVDGRLRELSYRLKRDVSMAALTMADEDGRRIYRRTLVMLLTAAVRELFPEIAVSVGYAVPDGGYYCLPQGRGSFSDDELSALEQRMREIAEANDPITKRIVPLADAVAMYQERRDEHKLRLLEHRSRGDLTLYTLRDYADYYYGYMLPSTGYVQQFRLVNTTTGGFILQYPLGTSLDRLPEHPLNDGKLCEVFEREEALLKRLNLEDIGRLNQIVRGNRVQELILVSEAIHDQRISAIASAIEREKQQRDLRLVLIAGPSSSGKTTFSKRLAIQLLAYGLRPFTLELDNYFVDRELTPRDEVGNYDYEALEAINLPLFNDQLLKLMDGEEVRLPRFNFRLGRSDEGPLIRLNANHILIVEGIHGINPRLVSQIAPERIFRVYVSALTGLNIDPQNRIATTDVRLLRRICRDAVQRGHNATATIRQWPSVRRGERRNIFPYQENADAVFNSALNYELASLRPIAEPLLLQVDTGSPEYIEANRMLSFLRWVRPFTAEQQARIPDTSLLREFVGGSILADYLPGDAAAM